MILSQNDLKTVNSLDLIRSRPEMYLPIDDSLGEKLLGRLIADILVSPDKIAHTARVDDWWVVGSNSDWIPSVAIGSAKDYFTRITPFPEAGPNSMHAEVLVTAFATDVVTFNEAGECVIQGQSDEAICNFAYRNTDWTRIIAFRISDSESLL